MRVLRVHFFQFRCIKQTKSDCTITIVLESNLRRIANNSDISTKGQENLWRRNLWLSEAKMSDLSFYQVYCDVWRTSITLLSFIDLETLSTAQTMSGNKHTQTVYVRHQNVLVVEINTFCGYLKFILSTNLKMFSVVLLASLVSSQTPGYPQWDVQAPVNDTWSSFFLTPLTIPNTPLTAAGVTATNWGLDVVNCPNANDWGLTFDVTLHTFNNRMDLVLSLQTF